MKYLYIFILLILLPPALEAKKITLKLNAKEAKSSSKNKNAGKGKAGSFKVEEINAEDLSFTGFDKRINATKESFFITNNTLHTLTCLEFEIEYLTTDGRQLDRRFHRIDLNIPPGETRKADIPSWDRQHSFYYFKSAPSRTAGTPFKVKFIPSAYYLKY